MVILYNYFKRRLWFIGTRFTQSRTLQWNPAHAYSYCYVFDEFKTRYLMVWPPPPKKKKFHGYATAARTVVVDTLWLRAAGSTVVMQRATINVPETVGDNDFHGPRSCVLASHCATGPHWYSPRTATKQVRHRDTALMIVVVVPARWWPSAIGVFYDVTAGRRLHEP